MSDGRWKCSNCQRVKTGSFCDACGSPRSCFYKARKPLYEAPLEEVLKYHRKIERSQWNRIQTAKEKGVFSSRFFEGSYEKHRAYADAVEYALLKKARSNPGDKP